ncbi:MAG TPA: acyl-homoserine-lactone synthase [Sphingomonas sp.]|uniref:acyl-homoserine-lactone synthase n=1 Tax=Sphingomonas sp. TaxID=28214 RepID=UPI002BB51D1A|nr:acyl-homoserine-lactone synthase [Sphingomonas sp.]HMI20856.1 acyl-homoserine-lactone synthase [Sphingomonas sp.]
MLHILSTAEPPYGAQALRGMFEARRRVFVDLLGWKVPVIDGRYEVDQYDTHHCTYLVLTDAAGHHLASARLLPTERPHILDSLYPHLCDGAAPKGPDIFEITRFCLERDLQTHDRRRARDTLVCALANHALERGIRAYSAIAERRWVEQIRGFGWRTKMLGPERREGSRLLAALSIAIDHDTPRRLRAAGLAPDEMLGGTRERAAA